MRIAAPSGLRQIPSTRASADGFSGEPSDGAADALLRKSGTKKWYEKGATATSFVALCKTSIYYKLGLHTLKCFQNIS